MSVRTGAASGVGRRSRLTGRAAVLAAVVLVLAVALIVPLRQYMEQRSRVAELEAKVELLQRERDRIEGRIERLRDPAYLEILARKCLGMVRPGEVSFVTVPEGGQPRAPRC
ncbi:MAG: FtsB family cell division protein [Actinomycetota bacterium]